MSQVSLILFTSYLVLALARSAGAVNLFAGCTDLTSPPDASEVTFQGSFNTADRCSNRCTEYKYSYYATTPDASCYCSNVGIPPANLVQGFGGTCSTTEVRVTDTSYSLVVCYAFQDLKGQPNFTSEPQTVDGVKECLGYCRSDLKAIFGTIADAPDQYNCICASDVQGTTNRNCGPGDLYVYNHPPSAAASGLTKRKAREAEAQRRRDAEAAICPWGLTACVIPGLESADAFECIDTSNDLESCGGCINGAYNNATATAGTICVQPGVELGAATCVNGRCVISECQPDFELVDDQCVLSV
ncbi:hypothetical protein I302_107049 [Kwoniella bestiolae CBS 10118]|uniref:Protein CPL1-like domain-containing protein n=1 Tax=Kwoniella bestiolae CBS 10118 TaxID=1296100 RepID=A0A1B9FZM7_9TREE|nr:hypothetical protein I302_05686 [Kwoniella bestiolae CBS 10118]OCF24227.1 hypothetical protein I302_05686 [Kwoniella bestiolae CBS 10118]